MPPTLIKSREIPQQFSSEDEAITYTNISNSVSETTTIVSSFNAAMNTLMKTSLN